MSLCSEMSLDSTCRIFELTFEMSFALFVTHCVNRDKQSPQSDVRLTWMCCSIKAEFKMTTVGTQTVRVFLGFLAKGFLFEIVQNTVLGYVALNCQSNCFS